MSGLGGRPGAGRLWIALVLLLCAVLYFLNLGDTAFLGKDEPKNAQAAREMAERGDWVLTTLAGEPWYDKPILYYWTARAGYLIFGVGELGARLGPALAGLLTVWLTALLARRVVGGGGAGALAALVLGTGFEFFWLARSAVPDTLLALSVTATMLLVLLAREGVRPTLTMHGAWAAAGVATLAKGPVGMVLPALIVGADHLLARRAGRGYRVHLWTGPLAFGLVALPWYSLATVRSQGQFFRDFILHFNVARYMTHDLPHQGPIYYYLPVLLLGLFPWSLLLPAALWRIAREWRRRAPGERDRLRLLLLWIAMPFLFFTFAGSKLPSYLLPVFPAVAILVAREMVALARARRGFVPRPLVVSVALFSLMVAGIVVAGYLFLAHHELGPSYLLPLDGVLAGTALVALMAVWLRRARLALAGLALAAVFGPLVAAGWLLGPLQHYASAKEVALAAMRRDPQAGQLLAFRFYDNSFFFYTDSRVERFWFLDDVAGRLDLVGTALCFAERDGVPQIRADQRMRVEPLESVGDHELLRLTRQPPLPSPPAPLGPGPRTPTEPIDLYRLLVERAGAGHPASGAGSRP